MPVPESNAMVVKLPCGTRCKVERASGDDDDDWWSFTPIKKDGTPDKRRCGYTGNWKPGSVIERIL